MIFSFLTPPFSSRDFPFRPAVTYPHLQFGHIVQGFCLPPGQVCGWGWKDGFFDDTNMSLLTETGDSGIHTANSASIHSQRHLHKNPAYQSRKRIGLDQKPMDLINTLVDVGAWAASCPGPLQQTYPFAMDIHIILKR